MWRGKLYRVKTMDIDGFLCDDIDDKPLVQATSGKVITPTRELLLLQIPVCTIVAIHKLQIPKTLIQSHQSLCHQQQCSGITPMHSRGIPWH